MTAAEQLAAFAAGLRYDDIPTPARDRMRDCLIDTVAVAVAGSSAPWSRIVVEQQRAHAGPGRSAILGSALRVPAEAAALANGVMAHAIELDSLRSPGAGVHPGAVLVPATLALAQELGSTGPDVLTALVAGCEAMFRIGLAARHSIEARGFHAPGITGPYGAAVAAGRLLGLTPGQMSNAIGIAGSMGGGLMEFAASGDGGMVKKLHLGRGAQAGIVAARLAGGGFTGPASVLEGRMGYLESYAAERAPELLTRGLGSQFETLSICFKRYPCHITAHTPVRAIEQLRASEGFGGGDVEAITIAGSRRMATMNANQAPDDLAMALYSVPFCVAVALVADPTDPRSFDEAALRDPTIRALAQRVSITESAGAGHGWATEVAIVLRDGRHLERHQADFPGTPTQPLDRDAMACRFVGLTRGDAAAQAVFDRLADLEAEADLGWLDGHFTPV